MTPFEALLEIDRRALREARRLMRRQGRIRNSAHRIFQDEAIAPWQIGDPFPGNTTAGAGILPYTDNQLIALQETNASTAEIRTLPDPVKSFLSLTLTLILNSGQNLVVRCNTPIWLGATVTQPALTQSGQYITFATVNHSISLMSVPCSKISFTGTQATITNKTGFRWMVQSSDGPTVT
jgi:hypothetical protein